MQGSKIISQVILFLCGVVFALGLLAQAAASSPPDNRLAQHEPAATAVQGDSTPFVRGTPPPAAPPAAPPPSPVPQRTAYVMPTSVPGSASTVGPIIPTAAPAAPGEEEQPTEEPSGEPTLPPLPAPPPADDGSAGDDRPPPPRGGCNASRIERPPRFLTLPFPPDPQMEVFHGWRYTHNNQVQCGIDYGKRNDFGGLAGFPVIASADGEACADRDDTGSGCVSGFGDRVLIRHNVDGQTFYTYYGHLESINPEIPIGNRSNTVRVRRGEVIGIAGDTGTYGGSIHLHYGIASPQFGWYDPYDIWTKAVNYPDPLGLNGLLSGPNHFWTTNPPTVGAEPVGDVRASLPADAMTSGVIDLSEWTQVAGRQSGVIEIWINGEKRGEANFGPVPGGGSSSTFSWEWDTTRERNGPHTVLLKAFGEDSRVTPDLTITDSPEASFLISVQNPIGYVYQPLQNAAVAGVVPIRGWASVEESTISDVEIWINGEKRGSATYGLPYETAGGDYGFEWFWDTTGETDGPNTVIVKAFAANGGYTELPSVYDIDQRQIVVDVENWSSVHKWVMR